VYVCNYSKGARGLSVFLCISASARQLQFHRYITKDSGAVVTPFMRGGNYPPRNFATLGPSEIRPPFISSYIYAIHINLSTDTGQESDILHHLTVSQYPMFLLNSRHPRVFATYCYPYPEVTGKFCRVPLIILNRHLCILNLFTCVGLIQLKIKLLLAAITSE